LRRADRLFRVIEILRRRRRAITAAEIARRLEVSVRTVYRDIRDLALSGTPIEGEAGVGYTLRPGYDLPPLMFDEDELEALTLGARIVASFGDAELSRASRSALAKVSAVLPQRLAPTLAESVLFAPRPPAPAKLSETLAVLRRALSDRRKVKIAYRKEDGGESERVVRPLAACFWGRVWTLSTYCELREGFRHFRIDRILDLAVLEARFVDEPGKTLRDLLIAIGPDAVRLLDE
jgi:predicted DNA-binding transcriptional regulator YafY